VKGANGKSPASGTSQATSGGILLPMPMVRTLSEWFVADIAEADRLMGDVFSTTSRALLNGPSGIGKSNFFLGLGTSMSAGRDFLHWRSHRAARVIYVDGEMPRRLLNIGRSKKVVRAVDRALLPGIRVDKGCPELPPV
jgi:hypothetical protein